MILLAKFLTQQKSIFQALQGVDKSHQTLISTSNANFLINKILYLIERKEPDDNP